MVEKTWLSFNSMTLAEVAGGADVVAGGTAVVAAGAVVVAGGTAVVAGGAVVVVAGGCDVLQANRLVTNSTETNRRLNQNTVFFNFFPP